MATTSARAIRPRMARRVVRRVRRDRAGPSLRPAVAAAGRTPERTPAPVPGRDPARGARPAAGGRRTALIGGPPRGSSAAEPREGSATGVARRVVELLLDAQQLVVLRHALAAGR